jgi:hypothetical protein
MPPDASRFAGCREAQVPTWTAQLLRIGDYVQLDDAAARDGEADDAQRPAAPSHHDARRAVDDGRTRELRELRSAGQHLAGHRRRPEDRLRCPLDDPEVAAEDDVGVEHVEQRLEISGARGRQEGVHDLSLPREIHFGLRRCPLHPSPRPARQLAGSRGRTSDDLGDLVEGHAERVAQDEGEPLGRAECLEHDEQRHPDRVGHDGLVLRIAVLGDDDGFRQPCAGKLLAPRTARPQRIQADAPDDGRKPAVQILDCAGLGAAQPKPRLLHGVLGLAHRAEHPVRDPPQVWSRRFELVHQPLSLVHGHILSSGCVIALTTHTRSM